MPLRVAGVPLARVLARVGFQLFFRFQNVATGTEIWRIDRLTGDSCVAFRCDYHWSVGSPRSTSLTAGFVPDTPLPGLDPAPPGQKSLQEGTWQPSCRG